MALGWPSVEWGLRNISSKELTEWAAYYAANPWGEERADMRAGIVASTVANSAMGQKKKFKPQDFIPEYTRPDGDQLLAKARMINLALGGKDRIGNGDDQQSSRSD